MTFSAKAFLAGILMVAACAFATPSVLKDITIQKSQDSISVGLVFAGDVPEKYRVQLVSDSSGVKNLVLAFLGASHDTLALRPDVLPKWIVPTLAKDKGQFVLSVHVFLTREVTYKSRWHGNVFHITFPNVVDVKNPFWKKPWLYVGLGAAAAGGAVIWITTSSQPTNHPIEPPDINLPD